MNQTQVVDIEVERFLLAMKAEQTVQEAAIGVYVLSLLVFTIIVVFFYFLCFSAFIANRNLSTSFGLFYTFNQPGDLA